VASGSHPQADHNNPYETAPLAARVPEIQQQKFAGADRQPACLLAALRRQSSSGATTASRLGRFWEEQGLLWCAFAFAMGVALYVVLPVEPTGPWLAGVGCAAALILLSAIRRQHVGWQAALALACISGVAAGGVRSAGVDAPRLAEPMNVTLTGRVLDRSADPEHARLVLSVETVDGWRATGSGFPEKIRMRVPKDSAGGVGELVRLRGRLFPPPGPVHPGGYDYSFRAYFAGIGASGFSYGPAELLGPVKGSPGLHVAALVSQVRTGLAERIRSTLQGQGEAALIVAVLVGERSGITENQEEALRAAGLAHILAISGLHMALFAGGTYGGVLLLLALVPTLALRWPTHKWAALAALLAAAFYLLLSGAGVATQRSFLMIALVFLGILAGRRGLTLRSVALAGLVLLMLGPERLFFPGFQMSFAAVICLVAVYELWRRRERGLETRPETQTQASRILRFLGRWAAGLCVTALVAGLATGIIGAHHFGRIAPFGLVGNVLGMPVFSLIVMPMGVLTLALMPFGLAALPLTVMAFGVSVLLMIAEFTAGLDADSGTLGKVNGAAALLFMSALFTGLLLPGRVRLVALVPLIAGMCVAGLSRPPDVQIASSGSRLAARDAHGELRFVGRSNSFLNDLWFQSEGVPKAAIKSRKMISPQKSCDSDGCVIRAYSIPERPGDPPGVEASLTIAVPKALEALELDCLQADIVVSDLNVSENCGAAMVLGRTIRSSRGAVSIWMSSQVAGPAPPLEPSSLELETVRKRVSLTAKPDIERMVYAIPDPPRPWNAHGQVTRQSLRRAMRRNVR